MNHVETVIVTRHQALVDLLRERGLVTEHNKVFDHVTADDVRGKRVIGILPMALAAEAESVIEIPLNLTPDLRGKELDLSTLRKIAGDAVEYRVSKVAVVKAATTPSLEYEELTKTPLTLTPEGEANVREQTAKAVLLARKILAGEIRREEIPIGELIRRHTGRREPRLKKTDGRFFLIHQNGGKRCVYLRISGNRVNLLYGTYFGRESNLIELLGEYELASKVI